MPDRPFALHITWTCFGTWLPGDSRGHLSRSLDPDRNYLTRQNIPGTPHSSGDRKTLVHAQSQQKHPSVRLDTDLAVVVCHSLIQAAQERTWRILRAAVMANHIHCLVMDCPNDGPQVRRILKGVSQADLNEHLGESRRWWTAGGSDRYKNDDAAIEAAIHYIAHQEFILAEIVDMQVFRRR